MASFVALKNPVPSGSPPKPEIQGQPTMLHNEHLDALANSLEEQLRNPTHATIPSKHRRGQVSAPRWQQWTHAGTTRSMSPPRMSAYDHGMMVMMGQVSSDAPTQNPQQQQQPVGPQPFSNASSPTGKHQESRQAQLQLGPMLFDEDPIILSSSGSPTFSSSSVREEGLLQHNHHRGSRLNNKSPHTTGRNTRAPGTASAASPSFSKPPSLSSPSSPVRTPMSSPSMLMVSGGGGGGGGSGGSRASTAPSYVVNYGGGGGAGANANFLAVSPLNRLGGVRKLQSGEHSGHRLAAQEAQAERWRRKDERKLLQQSASRKLQLKLQLQQQQLEHLQQPPQQQAGPTVPPSSSSLLSADSSATPFVVGLSQPSISQQHQHQSQGEQTPHRIATVSSVLHQSSSSQSSSLRSSNNNTKITFRAGDVMSSTGFDNESIMDNDESHSQQQQKQQHHQLGDVQFTESVLTTETFFPGDESAASGAGAGSGGGASGSSSSPSSPSSAAASAAAAMLLTHGGGGQHGSPLAAGNNSMGGTAAAAAPAATTFNGVGGAGSKLRASRPSRGVGGGSSSKPNKTSGSGKSPSSLRSPSPSSQRRRGNNNNDNSSSREGHFMGSSGWGSADNDDDIFFASGSVTLPQSPPPFYQGVPGDELKGGTPIDRVMSRPRPMTHWTNHTDARPSLRYTIKPHSSTYLTLNRKSNQG